MNTCAQTLLHMLQGGHTRGLVRRDGDLPPSGAWRPVNPLRPRFPVLREGCLKPRPLLAAASPPHPPLSSTGAILPQLPSFLFTAPMSPGPLPSGTQPSLRPTFHTDHSPPFSSLTETCVLRARTRRPPGTQARLLLTAGTSRAGGAESPEVCG